MGNNRSSLRNNTVEKRAGYTGKDPGSEPEKPNLGSLVQFVNSGNYMEAEKLAVSMIRDYPAFAMGWRILSYIFQQTGRNKEALAPMKKAADLMREDAATLNDLGVLQKKIGRLIEAEASYRKALKLNSGIAEIHSNLGNLLRERGLNEEAANCFRQAISLKSDFSDAQIGLGLALKSLGKPKEAEICFRIAIKLAPRSAEAHINLGSLLSDLYRFPEAMSCFKQAISLQPRLVAAHINMGVTLRILGQLPAAEASTRYAIVLDPRNPEAYNNLGNILREAGRLEEAIECYQHALNIKSDYAIAYSNLLFALNYASMASPEKLLRLARQWEQSVLNPQSRREARRYKFSKKDRHGKPLKIGYVSGDYMQHAVSYFIGQVFKHHDRKRVEVYAYSNNSYQDDVTSRIRSRVDQWAQISGMPDDICAQRIRADGIDILVDLSGHTAYNRLGVFARRAAPVQAHYLGYFGSTGLREMDYWIGDDITTPISIERNFSECIWRLPRLHISYEGKPDAPEPEWRSEDPRALRVGNFCNLSKLTPATIQLWAKVLRMLPQAKLLLKTKEFIDPTNRQRVVEDFAKLGIEGSRIELHDRSRTPDWHSHMAFYNQLDVVLDVAGANRGAATTCDSLWMGLPVITLTGDRVSERTSAALLNSIGRNEFVAKNDDEFVSIAHRVSYDLELRKEIRTGQRERMRLSAICDGKGLAMALEDAFEAMHEQWRNG